MTAAALRISSVPHVAIRYASIRSRRTGGCFLFFFYIHFVPHAFKHFPYPTKHRDPRSARNVSSLCTISSSCTDIMPHSALLSSDILCGYQISAGMLHFFFFFSFFFFQLPTLIFPVLVLVVPGQSALHCPRPIPVTSRRPNSVSVSYTHLTLPTIYSV